MASTPFSQDGVDLGVSVVGRRVWWLGVEDPRVSVAGFGVKEFGMETATESAPRELRV